METFGDRVREARKKRGMTQKQLAAAEEAIDEWNRFVRYELN